MPLAGRRMVRLMSVGTMSCREVIDARPARIDTVNPAVNALVAPADPESCPTAADEADGRLARGDPLDGAHRLPVVTKVMKVAGLACSGGNPVLRSKA